MSFKCLAVLASALFFVLGCFSFPTAAGAQTNITLTSAADVLALPDEKASRGIPVSVTGVVTIAPTEWQGQFYVQDSSGGVFVENKTNGQPMVGDVVVISGITRAGGYTPCITKPHWKKVGTQILPEAKQVSIEQLISGTEDGQRIEIGGVMRSAQINGPSLDVEIVSGGYRLHAFLPVPSRLNLQTLVGAKVLLKGTAATAYNAPLRHITAVTLYVPQASDFTIRQPAPANPFGEPITPLNAIAQYPRDRQYGGQVHVKGVVTYQRKGEDIFLQDASGGLQVKTKLEQSVASGDIVEAVGFPAVENFLPVLEDAVFRKTGEPTTNLVAQDVTVADLQKGLYHANYVSLKGVLVDRLARGIGRADDEPVILTTLVLENSNFLFQAEKDTTDPNEMLTSIPIGSIVEVTGICFLENDKDGRVKTVHMLLPTSYDVRIIKSPGWLTPQHLLISLAIVSVILLVAVSWSVMVSQKNSKLKSLVTEKEAAQKELQQAHDLLEWRVQERTKQLKVEMTARKETELQFRATLTERTRLAQELHDTLEQTITGIALQMDRVASQFEKNPENASHHLKLARSLTRQAQTDVRQSVWGLRSRAGEKFDLLNALNINSRQIVNGAGIDIQIETSGRAEPLSEIFEENLLRIGQEAITNAVKHSGAKNVKVELQFNPEKVALQIKDDGRGFVPETCVGPNEGHFGLLGIRERAERMGGQANVTSAPGAGTCICVEVPINQNNGQACQPEMEKHEEGV